jgi:hypothetical protein
LAGLLVCLIGGLLGGYASGGSASIDLLLKRGPSQSGYGSYIYPSQWERAAYEMEYWADRAFHMVWLALPFVLLGLLIGLAYAALVANPLKWAWPAILPGRLRASGLPATCSGPLRAATMRTL